MQRKNTLWWIAVTLILFPILVLLGLLMRGIQADALPAAQGLFYPAMTLHGLGNVGVWFVASMVVALVVISGHVPLSPGVSWFAFFGTVLGVVLLLVAVLLGRFAAGWYFLYPLPLMSQGAWPTWASVTFLLSLTVLGATWLVWSLATLLAISKKFTLAQALGWHYFGNDATPEVPPSILIVTVSMIANIACLVSGVVVLCLFYWHAFTGQAADALLMKNLTFFFGHVLVNISMYLGVAAVYEILPVYTNKPWKTNRITVISWNSVLLIVLLAYFHHLYLDFVQPSALQYIGQVASYVSSLPAALVTLFGALTLIFRSSMKWNITTTFLVLGLMGWGIGGMAAVIDSTIAINAKLHNTLWVPAHFHTYMVMGLVLMVLGGIYHYLQSVTQLSENMAIHKLVGALTFIGGYGFLAMFYLGGAFSVPRRYATYPADIISHGSVFAQWGLVFATLFLVALLVYTALVVKRLMKAFHVAAA